MGQNVPALNDGYFLETKLSDMDIEKKVGFKAVIPNSLSDGFSLNTLKKLQLIIKKSKLVI